MNKLTTTILLSFTILITSCTPIQMYPGAPRSRSEVAYLFFNSLDAEILEVLVDGVRNPHPGRTIEVLPGFHTLSVRYQEPFEDANTTILSEGTSSDDATGFGLAEVGTCSLRFEAQKGQSLNVRARASSYSLLSGPTPPSIELHEDGFFTTPLAQGNCLVLGKRPVVRL